MKEQKEERNDGKISENIKKKTVLCFSVSRGGRNKPEGPSLQKQAQARSPLHHWLKRLATCVLHRLSCFPSFPVCPLLRHFASMWRSLRQLRPLPIHIFPGMENVNWPVSKTFWSVCHSSRMMEKLMPSVCVCVCIEGLGMKASKQTLTN